MRITYLCPTCQVRNAVEVLDSTTELRCPSCLWTRPVSEQDRTNVEPSHCSVCGCADLWRQKDFPQRLGLLFVGTGAFVSTIFWWQMRPTWAIGVLLLFALIDGVLYSVMRDVLVCYRCNAQHRHTPLEGRNETFNLETHERYRQEAIRLEEVSKKSEIRSPKPET